MKDKNKINLKTNIIAFLIALVIFLLIRNSILQIMDINNMLQEFIMGVAVGSSMLVMLIANAVMLYNFVIVVCTLAYEKFKKNIFEKKKGPKK